jgi:hypothetical protein
LDWQNRSFSRRKRKRSKIPELKKEQAENIKQLLMGKSKTTVNEE